jgi:hypothetical protein
MAVKRIAVVYDISYLKEPFQSIRKFILSRRFTSQERQGLMGSLRSLMSGRSGKVGAENTVYHEPGSLFDIKEVVPNEVLKKLAQGADTASNGSPVVASLLEDGAVRVDLSMDTVVGEHGLPGLLGAALDAEPAGAAARKLREQVVGYAARLVKHSANDHFDLAIVASEDVDLLAQLSAMGGEGKPILGVTREHLSGTRLVHDKLTWLANIGRTNPLAIET